jgi:hypothetical protein
LVAVGGTILWLVMLSRSTLPVLILCLLPFSYVMTRAVGVFPTQPFVSVAATVSDARAQSLEFRFDNEDILIQRAMEQPVFGWGGWGRSRVYDRHGKDISVTDGLWIIALGKNGTVGLVSLLLVFTLPCMLLARRLPATAWAGSECAAAAVTAAVVLMTAMNALPNAPNDPVTAAMAGGLCGFVFRLRPKAPRTAASAAPAGRSSNEVHTAGRS